MARAGRLTPLASPLAVALYLVVRQRFSEAYKRAVRARGAAFPALGLGGAAAAAPAAVALQLLLLSLLQFKRRLSHGGQRKRVVL